MIDLTPSARQRFDDYLRSLRHSLQSAAPAEADDVEQSVREHIEIALAGMPAPVGGEQLAEVLDRLGAPEGLVPDDDRSTVQRVLQRTAQQVTGRLRSGPEEWRLAYLTFGLFLLSLILIPIGIGLFMMVASFVASRAYVEVMEAKQEVPGARRWLICPPIALFLALAIAFFIIGPAGTALAWGLGDEQFRHLLEGANVHTPSYGAQFVAGATMATLGAWWMLASLIAMVFLPVIRFIFKPLLTRVRRTHFIGLTMIGAVSLAVGYAMLRPWLSQLW